MWIFRYNKQRVSNQLNSEDFDLEKYLLKTQEDGTNIYVHDVHKVLLEMIQVIDKICVKHNIPYFLNGGSALGAVRHKGFIPWDDDLDIGMMLDDYNRFIEVLKTDLPNEYCFQCFDTHKEYNVLIPGMKIRKKGTYIEEVNSLLKNRCVESDGLFIDVFVYDYCTPNKFFDLPFRLGNYLMMPLLILIDNVGFNPVFLKKIFMKNTRFYGKLNSGSKYIGFDLTWTFTSPLKPFIFKKEDIYPTQRVPFENLHLPIAHHPHEYLCTAIAPSYMTPPPIKAQKPKHIVDIRLSEE